MTPAVSQLALSPLGAGDLIDRTIRLYRRHFTTLVRAAAPPVVASALGGVMLTVGWREVMLAEGSAALTLYVVLIISGFLLSWTGRFFFLLVMGGASRNLVLHLLWGEPVAARAIYRSVRARFWTLVLALVIILLIAGAAAIPVGFVWLMLISLGTFGAFALVGNGAFGTVVAFVLVVAFTLGALLIYFLIVGRVAYVPQVILVEGRSVSDAVGRSISLARGNVRRLTAMFLFTTFATYAVLMLLVIPLGWYGYLRGVSPADMARADAPLWYTIGWQALAQASSILLAPVWMLGLSLLYVDERVRHEGYDIELLARQRLGDMPDLPDGGAAPLARAIHDASAPGGDISYVPRFTRPRAAPAPPPRLVTPHTQFQRPRAADPFPTAAATEPQPLDSHTQPQPLDSHAETQPLDSTTTPPDSLTHPTDFSTPPTPRGDDSPREGDSPREEDSAHAATGPILDLGAGDDLDHGASVDLDVRADLDARAGIVSVEGDELDLGARREPDPERDPDSDQGGGL